METRTVQLASGGAIPLSLARPTSPNGATVILAPGAGSDHRHPALVEWQHAFADAGYAALAFDFPYRAQGRKLPDRQPVLVDCWREVIAHVRAADDLPVTTWLAIGGRSMGGRMATHALADATVAADALVLLGYPLHPAGKPAQRRDAHLERVRVPVLFVQGTRDALGTPDELRPALALMPHATLHLIDDADHGFHVRQRRTGRDDAAVRREVAATMLAWLDALRR